MLLGTVIDQDVQEWERMIAVNQNGLLFMTKAALPHLLTAAEDNLRGVADMVNVSSIAGRQAWANFAAADAENIPEKLQPEDIAESIAHMVTRHRRSSIAELWAMPTSQA